MTTITKTVQDEIVFCESGDEQHLERRVYVQDSVVNRLFLCTMSTEEGGPFAPAGLFLRPESFAALVRLLHAVSARFPKLIGMDELRPVCGCCGVRCPPKSDEKRNEL